MPLQATRVAGLTRCWCTYANWRPLYWPSAGPFCEAFIGLFLFLTTCLLRRWGLAGRGGFLASRIDRLFASVEAQLLAVLLAGKKGMENMYGYVFGVHSNVRNETVSERVLWVFPDPLFSERGKLVYFLSFASETDSCLNWRFMTFRPLVSRPLRLRSLGRERPIAWPAVGS